MNFPSFDDPDRAAASKSYFKAAIADEIAIAKMMGYRAIAAPPDPSYNSEVTGLQARAGNLANSWSLRLGTALPRWRRKWDGAGELISRCNLNVRAGTDGVVVSADGGHISAAIYSEHPGKDDAIRFAICQVAIAVLTAEKEPK